MRPPNTFSLPELAAKPPWAHLDRLPVRPEEFSFALLSDRTAAAQPGVFEGAVEVTNLLRPDFVVQLGDAIEGYTTDRAELARQWDEFDAITANLKVPLFRVAGNHDVSNDVMREEWRRRHGPLHYHFRYDDILVVVLDTQDPPEGFVEQERSLRRLPPEVFRRRASEIADLEEHDPATFRARLTSLLDVAFDWDGTMPAALSVEQVSWAEETIAEHADVRWTFLCMHVPVWQGDGHDGLDRIRRALGDRPFTAFAGHAHNYRRRRIGGRDHIRLGPTGGVWVRPDDPGNIQHVTLVTMTPDGPRIANLLLDGVRDADGAPHVGR